MKHRLAQLAVALWLACALGCAPKGAEPVFLQRPSDWPEAFAGRRLFNTQKTYIYASNPDTVADVDRLVDRLARDFEAATGKHPPKGLLLVTDLGDELMGRDLRALQKLIGMKFGTGDFSGLKEWKQAALQADIEKAIRVAGPRAKNSTPYPDTETPDPDTDDLQMRLEQVFLMLSAPVGEGDLSEVLGLPVTVARSVAWAAAVPTTRAIKEGSRQGVEAAIAAESRRRGLSPVVGKLLMAPLKGAVDSTVAKLHEADREIVIVCQWIRLQADWSDEQKLRQIIALLRRKLARIASPRLLDHLLSGYSVETVGEADASNESRK